MRGVGPADKTGKSVVTYCPGGSFLSPALPRPEKPREMIAIRYSPFHPKYRAVRTNQDCQLQGKQFRSVNGCSPESCKVPASGSRPTQTAEVCLLKQELVFQFKALAITGRNRLCRYHVDIATHRHLSDTARRALESIPPSRTHCDQPVAEFSLLARGLRSQTEEGSEHGDNQMYGK